MPSNSSVDLMKRTVAVRDRVYEIREGSTPARLELCLDGDHVGGATADGMGGMLVNAGKVAVTEAQEAIGGT